NLTYSFVRGSLGHVNSTLHKDNNWRHYASAESFGEWLSVADLDEQYTARILERRVGGNLRADGIRSEISLEQGLAVHTAGGRPKRVRGRRLAPGQQKVRRGTG